MNKLNQYEEVIKRSKKIENILIDSYKATGKGLHEQLTSIDNAIDKSISKKIRKIATIRNKLMHENMNLNSGELFDYIELCEQVLFLLGKHTEISYNKSCIVEYLSFCNAIDSKITAFKAVLEHDIISLASLNYCYVYLNSHLISKINVEIGLIVASIDIIYRDLMLIMYFADCNDTSKIIYMKTYGLFSGELFFNIDYRLIDNNDFENSLRKQIIDQVGNLQEGTETNSIDDHPSYTINIETIDGIYHLNIVELDKIIKLNDIKYSGYDINEICSTVNNNYILVTFKHNSNVIMSIVNINTNEEYIVNNDIDNNINSLDKYGLSRVSSHAIYTTDKYINFIDVDSKDTFRLCKKGTLIGVSYCAHNNKIGIYFDDDNYLNIMLIQFGQI